MSSRNLAKITGLRTNHSFKLSLLVLVAILLSACQFVPAKQGARHETPQITRCHQLLLKTNQVIEQAGLADAQYTKLADYPHLRVNRFLASLLVDVRNSPQYHQWLDRAGALALDGFRVELKNLGAASYKKNIQKNTDGINAAVLATQKCIQTLLMNEKEMLLPGLEIRDQARVDDNYKIWQRALGIYPLVIIPIAWGINNHQQEMQDAHKKTNLTLAKSGMKKQSIKIYQPPLFAQASDIDIHKILKQARKNPLSIPELSPQNEQLILNHFAPVWEVSGNGPADHIGTMAWSADGSMPIVQTKQATVYTKISYSRHQQKVLLQLNYIIWLPQRPLTSAFDLLGGHLDGITWRVTLDDNGKILMQDTIHNCGCYHMFYPGQQVQAKILPASLAEIAFVPQASPDLKRGERYKIHIATGTHYITGLSSATRQTTKTKIPVGSGANISTKTAGAESYKFAPYRKLRSLPHPIDSHKSMFNDEGLVPSSSRREQYLFWPLGIASAGAMRQWGRHATAFIGRRHFDDPDLIEKNFILPGTRKSAKNE